MIWVVYILLIVLYIILKQYNENFAKNYYLIVITLILCMLSALRNPAMGNDTYAYKMHFEEVNDKGYNEYLNVLTDSFGKETDDSNKDQGYNIFSKFCFQCLGGNFILYQFIAAAILLIPLAIVVKSNVTHFSGYIIAYSFYISIFYSWLPNSATRQTIAFGLYLWAIVFWLYKHKLIIPILLVLIASTIHKSVLINLIPIVLVQLKNKESYTRELL